MRKKRIFKKSLADELHKLGNEILKVEINKNNPEYLVYIFQADLKFYEDLTQLTNR